MKVEFGELLVKVDLSLSFGDFQLLKRINFDIYNTIGHGQIVALVGRSGVGKSQLFRCMSGLQVPTTGGVYIDGNAELVRSGQVGVVSQTYPLIETRTVLDNLLTVYAIYNKDKKTKGLDIAMQYLKHFGLESIAGHLPKEISGGQRQRVAIIQQMLCSRHYLIMDEPFSGLDIVSKDQACELIVGMSNMNELNTIILTTHDVKTACAVADRVIVIGRDLDTNGQPIPGTYVVRDEDLKLQDLCWEPAIHKSQRFRDFVDMIEDEVRVR